MSESIRRILFLCVSTVAFFQTGAHCVQAFVHYPAWGSIGADSFREYHRVMTPGALQFLLLPRIIEVSLAVLSLLFPPSGLKRRFLLVTFGLATVALLSTVLLQLPLQRQLGSIGNTPDILAHLRTTDWIRQSAETIRAGLCFWMLWLLLRPSATVSSKVN